MSLVVCMLQLGVCMPQLKIPHAVTKRPCTEKFCILQLKMPHAEMEKILHATAKRCSMGTSRGLACRS